MVILSENARDYVGACVSLWEILFTCFFSMNAWPETVLIFVSLRQYSYLEPGPDYNNESSNH